MARPRLFKNMGIKLISFFLALLLWLHVTTDRVYNHTVSVPLSLVDLPPRLVVGNLLPPTVNVRVRGKGLSLLRLNLHKVVVEVPGKGLKRGRNTVKLQREFFHSPPGLGIEVLEFKPATLPVELDHVATKTMHVKANLVGDPKPGYVMVGEIKLEPGVVEVTGPKSVLASVDTVRTQPLILGGADKTIMVTTEVNTAELFPNLECHPESVLAVIEIEPLVKRKLTGITVKAVHLGRGLRVVIEPPEISLTFSGPESVISQLNNGDVAACIELKNLRPGVYSLPARISFPPGLSIVKADPTTFEITIR